MYTAAPITLGSSSGLLPGDLRGDDHVTYFSTEESIKLLATLLAP